MRLEQVTVPLIRQVLSRPRLTDAIFSRLRWGNLFGEEFLADPYHNYDRYLDDGYVTYHRTYQSWFVLGYEEAAAVLASPDVSVADRFEMLLEIRPYSQLSDRSRGHISHWFLGQDPPDHTRLRRLVSRAFTPRRVAAMEPRIDAVAADLLDQIADDLHPEILEAFAAPLPVYAIGDILGLPRERWEWLREISDDLVDILDPFRAFDPEVMDNRLDELGDYILELAAARRAEPRDDLLSDLAAVSDDGDRLSEQELVSMVSFLMLAGHETTTGAIANAIYALHRFPDQQALLRAKPDLIDNAVEELLRFDTPVMGDPRVAEADLDLGGTTIPKGATITVLLGLANRDKRRFDDADQLRLDRPDPRPISFGHGIHYCIGAALARLEMKVTIPRFLNAFPPTASTPPRSSGSHRSPSTDQPPCR